MNSYTALRPTESPLAPPLDDGIPNFQRLSLLIRRHLPLLVLAGATGLGLALAFAALSRPVYDARAMVLMRRAAPVAAGLPEGPDAIPDPQLQNELEVIRSKELAAEVLRRLGPDGLPGAPDDPRAAEDFLRDSIAVSRIDESYIFLFDAVSADPETAARIANTYAVTYVAARTAAIAAAAAARRAALGTRVDDLRAALVKRRDDVLSASRDAGDFDLQMLRRGELEQLLESDRAAYAEALSLLRDVDRDADPNELRASIMSDAVPPEMPGGPRPFMIATLGIFLGLAAGGAVALARENLDATLRTGDEVRRVLGQPFLGYLPRLPGTMTRLGAPTHPVWRAAADFPRGRYAETLRFVRARAEDRGTAAGALAIGFCSARPDEGKSLAAANFAALLAAEGQRTLLIDAQTRGPGLGATFGAEGMIGLADLMPPGDPETALDTPGPGDFAFLPARGRRGSAPLHLDGDAFARLLDARRARYDFIVVDLPALDQAAFTRGLLPLLDGWVAVVRWGATPAHAPRTVLREEPGLARNLLGVVLSDLKPAALGRYTPHDRAAHDA